MCIGRPLFADLTVACSSPDHDWSRMFWDRLQPILVRFLRHPPAEMIAYFLISKPATSKFKLPSVASILDGLTKVDHIGRLTPTSDLSKVEPSILGGDAEVWVEESCKTLVLMADEAALLVSLVDEACDKNHFVTGEEHSLFVVSRYIICIPTVAVFTHFLMQT
ncbi:unnamed protein product [Protopolystoma xenopodis]|uniref:Uncharacterized protein n=1 Tax=Protopolystoma xenopodis TaxID=117903 RepID=A0A3S5A4F3_9PLAT|nr:unnamed protein product [Protopolystoma xenopodis]